MLGVLKCSHGGWRAAEQPTEERVLVAISREDDKGIPARNDKRTGREASAGYDHAARIAAEKNLMRGNKRPALVSNYCGRIRLSTDRHALSRQPLSVCVELVRHT